MLLPILERKQKKKRKNEFHHYRIIDKAKSTRRILFSPRLTDHQSNDWETKWRILIPIVYRHLDVFASISKKKSMKTMVSFFLFASPAKRKSSSIRRSTHIDRCADEIRSSAIECPGWPWSFQVFNPWSSSSAAATAEAREKTNTCPFRMSNAVDWYLFDA